MLQSVISFKGLQESDVMMIIWSKVAEMMVFKGWILAEKETGRREMFWWCLRWYKLKSVTSNSKPSISDQELSKKIKILLIWGGVGSFKGWRKQWESNLSVICMGDMLYVSFY